MIEADPLPNAVALSDRQLGQHLVLPHKVQHWLGGQPLDSDLRQACRGACDGVPMCSQLRTKVAWYLGD